jgi:hypothetical protein
VLEHIGTAGQKVTVIDGLDAVAGSLRVLVLRANLVRRMAGVGALTRLTELELYDNKVEALEDLEALSELETLDMSYNRVPAIGGALRGARALRRLYLAANKISRIEGLEDCAALEVLDLGANAIRSLQGLEGCGSLRELYLGKNKIPSLAPTALAPHLCRLKKLDLQSNRLTAITGLGGGLPELEELYLGHNGITDVDGLDGCPKLTVLDLTANRVAQLGSGLDGLTALTDLWVRGVAWGGVAGGGCSGSRPPPHVHSLSPLAPAPDHPPAACARSWAATASRRLTACCPRWAGCRRCVRCTWNTTRWRATSSTGSAWRASCRGWRRSTPRPWSGETASA